MLPDQSVPRMAVHARFEQEPVALLARTQRLLRLLALGDVPEVHGQALG
jgi:hypothetical protein